MPNKTLYFDDATAGQVAKLDKPSRYFSATINQGWPRAMMALDHLRAQGWQANEILAACDVLNGCWLHVHDPTWHGHSMADGPEYAGKWEIDPARWLELARQVSESVSAAFALDLVVSEFWAGNSWLDKMIRKGAPDESA